MEQPNQECIKYEYNIPEYKLYSIGCLFSPLDIAYNSIENEINSKSHIIANNKVNADIFLLRSCYLFRFFQEELKLKEYQALAIMCVLYSESNLNSDIGKTAHGLAQWTGRRKINFHNFATNSLGLKKQTTIKKYYFTAHTQFIKYELSTSYRDILLILQKSKTFEEAVDIVLRGYENGDGSTLASKRTINNVYRSQNLSYRKLYNDRINNKQYFKFLTDEL
jgi:hypothetical protein